MVRLALPAALLLLIVGCGGESLERPAGDRGQRARDAAQRPVPASAFDQAARGLLPPTSTSSAVLTNDGSCFGPFDRPVRCASLHVRGTGAGLAGRRRAFLSAARAHGWRSVRTETQPAGSTSLVFRRGALEGKVLLARSADVAIVIVTAAAPISDEEALFVRTGRAVCKRLAVALERIPRSLPRNEGLRRVRATWHAFVRDVERLTPPPSLRERHRAFVNALSAFESTLLPFRARDAAEAAKAVGRSAQAVGLPRCIPSR